MKRTYLKWKLKSLYRKIQNYQMYSGHSMQQYMDSRYYNLLISFNKTSNALAKIDPDCPTFRYDVS